MTPDGNVHDPRRPDHLGQHIALVRLAIDDGVDVRGYSVWSLLSNFEWTFGYAKRFWLVRVDCDTQPHTLKDSAKWYRQVVTHHSIDAA